MSSAFIPILVFIAHDAACKKGNELLFHGMAKNKEDQKDGSDAATDDEICCVVFCIMLCIILLVGIGFGIYYLITNII